MAKINLFTTSGNTKPSTPSPVYMNLTKMRAGGQMSSIYDNATFQTSPTTQNTPTQTASTNTNTTDYDIIQGFLNKSKGNAELESRRNAVIQMLQNQEDETEIADTIQNKMNVGDIINKQANIQIDTQTKDDRSIGQKGLDLLGDTFTEVGDFLTLKSNADDSLLETGAKFALNLPGDTLELVGDIVKVASHPIETGKSILDLGSMGIEKVLNKALSGKTAQGILEGLGVEKDKLEQIKKGQYFTKNEYALINQGISEELNRLTTEKGAIKGLITENPADVLFTFVGGLGVAKSTAKARNLTGLANKIEKVEQALNPITIQSKVLNTGKNIINKGKESITPKANIDDLILKVSQGEAQNIEGFKKAISQVDTTNVKTYVDLKNVFDNKIKDLIPKQNELFLLNDTLYNIENLTKTSKGGTRAVNYVDEALDDMIKLYDKLGEIEDAERLEKLNNFGYVTTKEINDLAREYNTMFGRKAFNLDGSQKFSDIGMAYEKTRKGLKDLAREKMPDEATKIIDQELSSLYEARQLSEEMIGKVDNLRKKIIDRRLTEELFNRGGKLFNTITGNSLKGFLSAFFPSNIGLKIGNAMDIQNTLSKNLKQIDKLLKNADKVSDSKLIDGFLNIIKDNSGKIGTAEIIKEISGK